jgi:hypothetical protein
MTAPHGTNHLPFAGSFRSEPDKYAPILIANYQVDGYERRDANDLSKFVPIKDLVGASLHS